MAGRSTGEALETAPSNIRPRETRPARKASRVVKSNDSSSRAVTTTVDREAQCRQKALEKQFGRAQRASLTALKTIEYLERIGGKIGPPLTLHLFRLHVLRRSLPPLPTMGSEDTRLCQDINKLATATKYSTDTTLNIAKFAS